MIIIISPVAEQTHALKLTSNPITRIFFFFVLLQISRIRSSGFLEFRTRSESGNVLELWQDSTDVVWSTTESLHIFRITLYKCCVRVFRVRLRCCLCWEM
jgi:hypothetical protein